MVSDSSVQSRTRRDLIQFSVTVPEYRYCCERPGYKRNCFLAFISNPTRISLSHSIFAPTHLTTPDAHLTLLLPILSVSSNLLTIRDFPTDFVQFQYKLFPWFSVSLQFLRKFGFTNFYILQKIRNILPTSLSYQQYLSDNYFKSYVYFKRSISGLILDHFKRL